MVPNGLMCSLCVPLLLVVLCDAKPFLKKKACGLPDLPAHSAYQCQPPLCQGALDPGLFKSGTVLEFYCQPGYILASQPALFICQGGQWSRVQDVVCKPQGTSLAPPRSSLLTAASVPIIAAAALTLSAFLVTVLSCVLLKPRSSVCRCYSGAYQTFEDSDTMEHVWELDADQLGRSVDSLPTYEEAVCGHTGNPLLPGAWGPRPLVLSEGVLSQPEPPDPGHVAGEPPGVVTPPPSYQEALAMAAESLPGGVQSTRGPAQLSFPLSGKENGP